MPIYYGSGTVINYGPVQTFGQVPVPVPRGKKLRFLRFRFHNTARKNIHLSRCKMLNFLGFLESYFHLFSSFVCLCFRMAAAMRKTRIENSRADQLITSPPLPHPPTTTSQTVKIKLPYSLLGDSPHRYTGRGQYKREVYWQRPEEGRGHPAERET